MASSRRKTGRKKRDLMLGRPEDVAPNCKDQSPRVALVVVYKLGRCGEGVVGLIS